MEYKDYYSILGVGKNANKEEISKAYKKLARKYHPDLNQGDARAEEKFKDVNEAYEVLKDDEKRKKYDMFGSDWAQAGRGGGGSYTYRSNPFGAGAGPFGGAGPNGGSFHFESSNFDGQGFSEFFQNLFGGRQQGRRSGFTGDPFANTGFSAEARGGLNQEVEVKISLEDAVRGGEKQIRVQIDGEVKTLKVNLPAGVKEGAKLRLAGQGHLSRAGGKKGDLLLKIVYAPHPKFTVEGQDLVYDAEISPWEAVLGTSITVPTLDGSGNVRVPSGTSSGKKMRLRGKGLGARDARGDLYVRIGIRVPTRLTDKERELWEALAREAGK